MSFNDIKNKLLTGGIKSINKASSNTLLKGIDASLRALTENFEIGTSLLVILEYLRSLIK
jgi:hypothetical protein